ncbi:NUDIX domain-containing protein [Ferruginibacter yonginensis]|uniref:NUDIX domain-containing protein n=1 Tax=Ferruginibacter yonginensis TaxID=1310416 RepID=A0ABV8QMU4_9BACT
MITIRVYGILMNDQQQILVSDELIRGMKITKFCGGGLEEGEGTRDCLQREFMEEMGLQIAVGEHLYTTDFYQPSAFRKGDQILSIYYYVKALEPLKVVTSEIPFDFSEAQMQQYQQLQQIETFRWIPLKDYSAANMTLPIDKIVANLLKEKY